QSPPAPPATKSTSVLASESKCPKRRSLIRRGEARRNRHSVFPALEYHHPVPFARKTSSRPSPSKSPTAKSDEVSVLYTFRSGTRGTKLNLLWSSPVPVLGGGGLT